MILESHASLRKEKISPEEIDPNTKYIGLEHIGESTLSLNGFGFASDVNSSKAVFEKGDILFGKLRPYFRKVIIAPFDGICSTDIWVVKPKNGIDRNFLFYWMASQDFVDEVTRSSEGTRMPRAKWEVASKIEIPDVETEKQKKIGEILYTLDQKIHLNQQTNETLEAMAAIAGVSLEMNWYEIETALQRKLDRMTETKRTQLRQTAEIFPDELVESEIGEVPKGWEYDQLGNFITVKRGGSPRPIKDFVADEGLHWTKISDATSENSPFIMTTKEFIKEEGLKKTVLLEKGSLILSNSATPGLPKFLNIDACIHDGWLYFPDQEHFTDLYLYHLFIEIRKALVAKGSGIVFTNLKTSILRNYDIVVPNEELVMKFTETAQSIFAALLNNREETKTLTNLRDTLLPKLISGEVGV